MFDVDFVEEINFDEIELQEVVGKGTYGTVRKGKWKGYEVAVKMIETEQEKNAFKIEVRQLSRVKHDNIVKLYGACTKSPVCLVMEYAEGGSLYNVLHCMPNVDYTVAHAISWVFQCARGVAYLHNMKPRPLIHRDLKPPNLLLIMGGTVLKICDFGTACDKHTNMTNNKGSAAWMAPEVFEGSQYSEKCDVFSWAIILWEVLTRRKPFHEIGAAAFCIMWAVHSGRRPPLIKNCPKPLEDLMTRCWAKDPVDRPSMSEVEAKLLEIIKYIKGADKPITYPVSSEASSTQESSLGTSASTKDKTKESQITGESQQHTVLPIVNSSKNTPPSLVIPSFEVNSSFLPGALPSLTSSRSLESIQQEVCTRFSLQPKKNPAKRFSDNLDIQSSFQLEPNNTRPQHVHHRTGSYGAPPVNKEPELPLTHFLEENLNYQVPNREKLNLALGAHEYNPPPSPLLDKNYFVLEPRLRPLPPAPDSKESMKLYHKHVEMIVDYNKVQAENHILEKRKEELTKELQEGNYKTSVTREEYFQLKKDKESLSQLRDNLKRQLEQLVPKRNNEDWVII